MSEYQYYEFQAVDHRLTRAQMDELRALSTRAVITPNSLTNTYHFGDFRGNPQKLMESYFDAHVYVSNFGTVRFMLRLSQGVLPDDTLARYSVDESLDWWSTDAHTILEWRVDEEPPDDFVEGEGWMARLLPIRDELIRGDYRSLYIGWLSSVSNASSKYDEEEDEDGSDDTGHREPPVPAGLGALTGAQAALAEFLGVSIDLIAAAAEASPAVAAKDPPRQKVDTWVAQLPEEEIRTIIARIIQGEGSRVQTELQSRFYRSYRESKQDSSLGAGSERRTADELLELADKKEQDRKRRVAEEKERTRHEQLAGLVPRFTELWASVNRLAEEQSGPSYDKTCSLLVDMRDAYDQAGRRPDFDKEFTTFMERHGRRGALVRRFEKARLVP